MSCHTVRKCPLGKQPQGLFASLPAGLSGSLILGKIWLIIGFPPLASRSGRETKWPRQDRGKLHERERDCAFILHALALTHVINPNKERPYNCVDETERLFLSCMMVVNLEMCQFIL